MKGVKEKGHRPNVQYENMMSILDRLKLEKMPEQSTPEISQNIQKIQSICNQKYNNQEFYGNAALNRQMLLDKDIANNLTPAVIRYLFINKPTKKEKIKRNSSGLINLRDAIYYGFKDGLRSIQSIPYNDPSYNPSRYREQKEAYQTNTLTILRNIKKAGGSSEELSDFEQDPTRDLSKYPIEEKFRNIVQVIEKIKENRKNKSLLHVPIYTAQNIRDQVNDGFNEACLQINGRKDDSKVMKDNSIRASTLDEFCADFLSTDTAILNGIVGHTFYDRLHLEAILENQQKKKIKIGEQSYTYKEIFSHMVKKVSEDPSKYPNAWEQLCLRIELVDQDLQKRFPNEYSSITTQKPLKSREKEEKVDSNTTAFDNDDSIRHPQHAPSNNPPKPPTNNRWRRVKAIAPVTEIGGWSLAGIGAVGIITVSVLAATNSMPQHDFKIAFLVLSLATAVGVFAAMASREVMRSHKQQNKTEEGDNTTKTNFNKGC